MNIEFIQWGQEQLPLIIIDDFYPDPECLIEQAENALFSSAQNDLYPGQRVQIDDSYSDYVCRMFIEHGLPILDYKQVSSAFSLFSVTTTKEQDLLPIQCIPHFDQTNPHQWATVHYLFKQDCGGTGFFRHRRSGYESVSDSRVSRYQRILEDEAFTHGLPPKRYIQSSNTLFELVEHSPAKFNRAIMYPSNVLHTGLINPDWVGSSNARRLTANSLFTLS